MSKKKAKITKGGQSINSNRNLGEVEFTLTLTLAMLGSIREGTSSGVEVG